MSKAIENRLDKLERALGVVAVDDGDDLLFQTLTAAQVETAHRALLALAMTWPPSDMRAAWLAEIEAGHAPGPRRVRRMRPPAELALDLLLASRGDDGRAVQIAPGRGFDPAEPLQPRSR